MNISLQIDLYIIRHSIDYFSLDDCSDIFISQPYDLFVEFQVHSLGHPFHQLWEILGQSARHNKPLGNISQVCIEGEHLQALDTQIAQHGPKDCGQFYICRCQNKRDNTVGWVDVQCTSLCFFILGRDDQFPFDLDQEVLEAKVKGNGRNADREDNISILWIKSHRRKHTGKSQTIDINSCGDRTALKLNIQSSLDPKEGLNDASDHQLMNLQLNLRRILFNKYLWRVEKIASFSLDIWRTIDLDKQSLRTKKRSSHKCRIDLDIFIGGLIVVNLYVLAQHLGSISQCTRYLVGFMITAVPMMPLKVIEAWLRIKLVISTATVSVTPPPSSTLDLPGWILVCWMDSQNLFPLVIVKFQSKSSLNSSSMKNPFPLSFLQNQSKETTAFVTLTSALAEVSFHAQSTSLNSTFVISRFDTTTSPIAKGSVNSKAGGLIGNGTDSNTPGFVMQSVHTANSAIMIILSPCSDMQYLSQDIYSNHLVTLNPNPNFRISLKCVANLFSSILYIGRMLTLQFLDRLDAVCFEGLEKENHLLSKKVNEKPIVPFAERVMVRKPGKKITFKLDPEKEKTEEHKEGSEKIEVVSKRVSKISTEQSLSKRESEVISGVGKVLFPSDFKERLRILKGMR